MACEEPPPSLLLLHLMEAEDNRGYFNQVWVQRGRSGLMGAEWCVDYVKGSLLTDETASLPGPVQAERTVTQCGRRAHMPRFVCLPYCWRARNVSATSWYRRGGSASGKVPEILWLSFNPVNSDPTEPPTPRKLLGSTFSFESSFCHLWFWSWILDFRLWGNSQLIFFFFF